MTLRQARRLAILIGALLVMPLPGPGGRVSVAAPRLGHFQLTSSGFDRFLTGVIGPGTHLDISSLTVDIPSENAPVTMHLWIFHGATDSCENFTLGPTLLTIKVPAQETLHLTFPEPLVATVGTDNWCFFLATDVLTDLTLVGVSN